jgi:hypothetical protein
MGGGWRDLLSVVADAFGVLSGLTIVAGIVGYLAGSLSTSQLLVAVEVGLVVALVVLWQRRRARRAADQAAAVAEWIARIGDLGDAHDDLDLRVLEKALGQLRASGAVEAWVLVEELFSVSTREAGLDGMTALYEACERLEKARFLESVTPIFDGSGVVVRLADEVVKADGAVDLWGLGDTELGTRLVRRRFSAGSGRRQEEAVGMLEEMLVYMVQGGKDRFTASDIAAHLNVPEHEVTPLYRRAKDLGWVEKISDAPPILRLTGQGWSEGKRLLAARGGGGE